jgi:hypothetical protein
MEEKTSSHVHDAGEGVIALTIELHMKGVPPEVIEIEYEGDLTHHGLAHRLAEMLELEADELLHELNQKPHTADHEHRHCHVELVCVDIHFETEGAMHKFLATSTWERVHRWGCKHFKVASDACANLELHEGTPKGPALNETKPICHLPGCQTVWLVKPGPERNGR